MVALGPYEEAALNIIKLLELWVIVPEYNSGNLAYGIMKADMFRQLGRFEDCLVVLNSVKSREILLNSNCSEWDRTINSDDYTNIINLIEQSCNEKIRCPRKIVIGDGDASDRNINSDDYDDLINEMEQSFNEPITPLKKIVAGDCWWYAK